MSTHAVLSKAGSAKDVPAASPDKAGWTTLQELHYLLGMWDGVPGSPVRRGELPEWKWVPNDEWRMLEGLLSDHPEHDTSEMKARALAEEEEHDARKFGRRPFAS